MKTFREGEKPVYPPIESYGIIGDLQTTALVGSDGAIDYLPLPRFASPTAFLALLDQERGGRFAVTPELEGARTKQLYLPETNVLLTRFLAPSGLAEITDYMPVHLHALPSRIVRRLKVIRGTVRFDVCCAPRFGYGRTPHTVEQREDGLYFVAEGGALVLRLTSSAQFTVDGGDARASIQLAAGEKAWFLLEHIEPGVEPSSGNEAYIEQAFRATVDFWRGWIGQSTYRGRWRDEVHRAALALKLLHCRNTGAILAAPTFGLPEVIGGGRNWDYRYTWIRDAAFTLYAFIRLGLTTETGDFIGWLRRQTPVDRGEGPLRTLYPSEPGNSLEERELDWLAGYRGSRPVRVGNAAADQLQLDIYGALLDAFYLYDQYGEATSHDLWLGMREQVEWVSRNWDRPDEGIWEGRNGRRHHLYSRVMCWVAIDRGIRVAVRRSLPAPLARWYEVRDAIYQDVFTNFWSEREGAFVGVRGTDELDAACLIMPLVRFLSPTDPRWLSTMRAVERELVSDSLVHRYQPDAAAREWISPDEGTFTICSFWYTECLARSGQVEKARLLFEKTLGFANHVGLFAEEIGLSGEQLGNFPQAFTHLALISAAYDLNRRLEGLKPGAGTKNLL